MTRIADLSQTLRRDRPLLILDADEVLLRFVETLEAYLLTQDHELRLTSFQLTGNVYPKGKDTPATAEVVRGHIAGFFEACADSVPLVEGAREALDLLSSRFGIVILSNVPSSCRARREASLHAMGLPYPVIANKGDKGPVAAEIAALTDARAVFVDDLPPQLSSVARHAPHVHRVHFVADPRLGAMIGKAPDAHVRFGDWPSLEAHLHALLDEDA